MNLYSNILFSKKKVNNLQNINTVVNQVLLTPEEEELMNKILDVFGLDITNISNVNQVLKNEIHAREIVSFIPCDLINFKGKYSFYTGKS